MEPFVILDDDVVITFVVAQLFSGENTLQKIADNMQHVFALIGSREHKRDVIGNRVLVEDIVQATLDHLVNVGLAVHDITNHTYTLC